MKKFERQDLLFSLCGLNCSLCTMKLGNYCPGCGGGAGNQGCPIAKCSLQNNVIEYCYQCKKYPCEKYKGIDEFDSFITHRNQLKDMDKIKNKGLELYHLELREKTEILKYLLENYNDGRRKNFFSIAVNLLELDDIKNIMEQISVNDEFNTTLKEKATLAVTLFQFVAKQKNIILKLNKKQ